MPETHLDKDATEIEQCRPALCMVVFFQEVSYCYLGQYIFRLSVGEADSELTLTLAR